MQKTVLLNKNTIKSEIEVYLKSNEEARFIHRLQVLHYIADNEQTSCEVAGKLFNTSSKAILNWMNKVNETGDIQSLRDQPGKGRKTQLTEKDLQTIEQSLKKHPTTVGISADIWNGKTLAEYVLKKTGIKLQERQCQRILQKMGSANKKGRPKIRPE